MHKPNYAFNVYMGAASKKYKNHLKFVRWLMIEALKGYATNDRVGRVVNMRDQMRCVESIDGVKLSNKFGGQSHNYPGHEERIELHRQRLKKEEQAFKRRVKKWTSPKSMLRPRLLKKFLFPLYMSPQLLSLDLMFLLLTRKNMYPKEGS